jgi:sugar phosphate permease
MEIHREPGAGMALKGALIFTVGIALVVWMRPRPRESGLVEVENEVVSQGIVV